MAREILNNQRQEFNFFGRKKSTIEVDDRERKRLKRLQILNEIDGMIDEVWAEYEKLDNKRCSVGYFLLSLNDKFSALKSKVHPSWRHEVTNNCIWCGNASNKLTQGLCDSCRHGE